MKTPEKIFQKKYFSDPAIPQKQKISKILNFPKSSEKCLKYILWPKWGVLSEKWRFGARLKWDNAIIENRYVPPPLKQRSVLVEILGFNAIQMCIIIAFVGKIMFSIFYFILLVTTHYLNFRLQTF